MGLFCCCCCFVRYHSNRNIFPLFAPTLSEMPNGIIQLNTHICSGTVADELGLVDAIAPPATDIKSVDVIIPI